jgi:hypothetical protein
MTHTECVPFVCYKSDLTSMKDTTPKNSIFMYSFSVYLTACNGTMCQHVASTLTHSHTHTHTHHTPHTHTHTHKEFSKQMELVARGFSLQQQVSCSNLHCLLLWPSLQHHHVTLQQATHHPSASGDRLHSGSEKITNERSNIL